jgi:hypothetical protein
MCVAWVRILFFIPITGHKVQGLAHAPTPDHTSIYETVTCAACNGVHLVNPSNGHVAGADVDASARKP